MRLLRSQSAGRKEVKNVELNKCIAFLTLAYLIAGCKNSVSHTGSNGGNGKLVAAMDTWLKVTDLKMSTDLERSVGKCRVMKHEKLTLMEGTKPKLSENRHYFIELAKGKAIPGCDFDKGYIWGPHFDLFPPTKPLAAKKYKSPINAIGFSSMWCECRSIGTSPHIGQDMVNNNLSEPQYSFAPRGGRITRVGWTSSACGREVELLDAGGVKWLFLHIDTVFVSSGQNVNQGDRIGHHDYYPRPGCGNGSHLHLERLSQGDIVDAGCAENVCQYGRRRCGYDPISIFDGRNRDTRFYPCK